MGISDFIGGRGEAIAFTRLVRVCRTDSDLPYFWPHYLIISVHGSMNESIPSITTGHELTSETLKRLWDEVLAFWQSRDMTRPTSSFMN